MNRSRRWLWVGLLVGSLALGVGAEGARADSEGIAFEQLDDRLEHLRRREHSLRRVLEHGQTEAERLRERVILRGRAYYRATRGLPGEDLMDYAVRIERLRQGVLSDLNRLQQLSEQRARTDRKLSLVRERRAPLELEHRAAGLARDALLSQRERERAFEMAFSTSSSGLSHTAVYSAESSMDFGESNFATMRGRLPFPVPGRAEVEEVRLRHASGPGLVLKGAIGVAARAVFAGRVAFADDYSEYGKTVILDHGNGYFTVSAGLDRIDVGVGDEVPQSARLGLVGSLSGAGKLYFEIRRQNETLPPGEWLGI